MGLYKNFIEILRHTKDNSAFTTQEVVECLENVDAYYAELNKAISDEKDMRKQADSSLSSALEKEEDSRIQKDLSLTREINKNKQSIIEVENRIASTESEINNLIIGSVANGSITTNKLANGAVTGVKLNNDVRDKLNKTDTIEQDIFTITNTQCNLKCVLPTKAPTPFFAEGDERTGHATIEFNSSSIRFMLNGKALGFAPEQSCRFGCGENNEPYIVFKYSLEDGYLAIYGNSQFVETSVRNGFWEFTAYEYNIHTGWTADDSAEGGYYTFESYSVSNPQANADSTGATYTIIYDYIIPSRLGSLSDLKTESKSSIIEAINELSDYVFDPYKPLSSYANNDFTYLVDDDGTEFLYATGSFESGTYLNKELTLSNIGTAKSINLKFDFASEHIPVNGHDIGGFNFGESKIVVCYTDGTEYRTPFDGYLTSTVSKNIGGEAMDVNKMNIGLTFDRQVDNIKIVFCADNFVQEGIETTDICEQDFWVTRLTYSLEENLSDRLSALETAVGTANASLEAMLSEGV